MDGAEETTDREEWVEMTVRCDLRWEDSNKSERGRFPKY